MIITDKKVYLRGKIGTYWYNFTESLAYVAIHRKTPSSCNYFKVKYGDGKKQFINICIRKDLNEVKKPMLIYIHGGGWISGITDMRDTYAANWADSGFFTASISYTYAPDKIFPTQLHEIFAALDMLYDNREKYNFDSEKIVLAGESAGGYYIMMLAALAKDKALFDKLGIEFRHKDEFDVKALVSHCGCFDLPNLLDDEKLQSKFPDIKMMTTSFLGRNIADAKAYLKTAEGQLSYPHITSDFPPAFVVWAARDYLRYEAFDFIRQYNELGIPFEEYKADGIIGQHAWSIATVFPKGADCFEKAYNFVLKHLE